MQVVCPTFCQFSKFQARYCLRYNAVKYCLAIGVMTVNQISTKIAQSTTVRLQNPTNHHFRRQFNIFFCQRQLTKIPPCIHQNTPFQVKKINFCFWGRLDPSLTSPSGAGYPVPAPSHLCQPSLLVRPCVHENLRCRSTPLMA